MDAVNSNNPTPIWWILLLVAMWILTIMLTDSCTTTKYVPYESKTTQFVAVHDTIESHDTLYNNSTTTIRELDSTAMAAWGITLAKNQKAWLVDRQNLERQISSLRSVMKDTVRDTIVKPQIVTVPEKSGSKITKTNIVLIGIIILLLIMQLLVFIKKKMS